MGAPFVHLHTHSEYSLLDGALRIKDMVAKAASLGMPALALTDHGVMYGAIDFYREATRAGIKPIIGCEVYVAPRSRLDRQPRVDDRQYHLVLLARNQEGYKNLTELVSRAYLEGFYYKPRVDHELIENYAQGLIALSACLNGEIPENLLAGKYNEARDLAAYYRDVFGPGNFYLEVQDHGIPEQRQANEQVWRIARELSLPVVATNDVHYLNQEDAFVHDVLLCIQTGKTIADPARMRFPTEEFYFKSEEEMQRAFPDHPEALANTVEVAARCQVDFEFGTFHLPRYDVPQGYTAEAYLRQMVKQRLHTRYPDPGPEIIQRLEYELGVIVEMGFAEYFLIVQDIVNYARDHRIPVGPGRGSAAGSLVSYVLGITSIDPLQYGLIFERFLNPERVSMPDIDVDFCFEKRDRIIDYIIGRYGQERVAQIITFGTMAARAAIRDVGRVLEVPYSEVDAIAKAVPAELGVSLQRALEISPQLQNMYHGREDVRRIIDTARALEGMPRHASVHAAGIVIGREPLMRVLPLQKMADGHVVTQFAKETVEDIGLLKMDILGLRTLTVIDHTLENIRKSRGIEVDLSAIPLDDPAVYELLGRGDTTGVFQLESDGLRRILTELKPGCFEDIIAVIALYRPGPLGSGMVEDFIGRKHSRQKVDYLHPLLEPILKETYGVILYQEQVMSIASRLAGFTMGEADSLRRAMGKKKPQEIARMRDKFIEGAARNGITSDVAGNLFNLMEAFAGYGFNKSHSAAYARVSYETAYLKAHYPVEYMGAFLSSVIDSQDRVVYYLKECKKAGIKILPPDINASDEGFTVSSGAIRFGLGAIKNLGEAAVASIREARREGPFTSLFDFCQRVDIRHLGKRALENLILAGAFDSLGLARREAMQILDDCLSLAESLKEARSGDQMALFGIGPVADLEPVPSVRGEYPLPEKLKREKEVLGFYASMNPLEEYRDILAYCSTHEVERLAAVRDGEKVTIAGILSSCQHKTSKKGDPWASLEVEDLTGKVEVIVFPQVYLASMGKLSPEAVVQVWGRVMKEDEAVRIAALRIDSLPERVTEVHLRLESGVSPDRVVPILKQSPGKIPVYVHRPGRGKLELREDLWVDVSPALHRELVGLCGRENVWFK